MAVVVDLLKNASQNTNNLELDNSFFLVENRSSNVKKILQETNCNNLSLRTSPSPKNKVEKKSYSKNLIEILNESKLKNEKKKLQQ